LSPITLQPPLQRPRLGIGQGFGADHLNALRPGMLGPCKDSPLASTELVTHPDSTRVHTDRDQILLPRSGHGGLDPSGELAGCLPGQRQASQVEIATSVDRRPRLQSGHLAVTGVV